MVSLKDTDRLGYVTLKCLNSWSFSERLYALQLNLYLPQPVKLHNVESLMYKRNTVAQREACSFRLFVFLFKKKALLEGKNYIKVGPE